MIIGPRDILHYSELVSRLGMEWGLGAVFEDPNLEEIPMVSGLQANEYTKSQGNG
jgi:hypothetical protein